MYKFTFLPLIIFLSVTSCNSNPKSVKYLVVTKVQIKSGEIDKVLQLFKDTNPALVKNQSDWVKAIFSKNEETSTVMVQAYWQDKESYLRFSSSPKFKSTMKDFAKYFNEKPSVEINEILFEM